MSSVATSDHQYEVLGLPELLEHILSFLPVKDLWTTVPRVCKAWQTLTLNPTLQKELFLKTEERISSEDKESAGSDGVETEKDTTFGIQGLGMFRSTSPFHGTVSCQTDTPVRFNPFLFQARTRSEQMTMSRKESRGPKFAVIYAPIAEPNNKGHQMLLTQPGLTKTFVDVELRCRMKSGTRTFCSGGDSEFSMQDKTGVRIGNFIEAAKRAVETLELEAEAYVWQNPNVTWEKLNVSVSIKDHYPRTFGDDEDSD